MTRQRLFLLIIALLLIVLSWWQIAAARTGLVVQSLSRDGIPMLYVAPDSRSQKMPGVLIAHGFAGSKQLMLGYAYTLAHAGYAVMLWDFGGHGANRKPLARLSLQTDLNTAYKALLAKPGVDPQRVAVLGHSMGSGAAMTAAILDRDRFAATVAISPTKAEVTPQVPANLQLQAGNWEPRFVANAQQLLQQAGGDSQGRSLVVIPNAEHITILFRRASHQAAKAWLDRSFGSQNSSNYIDNRMAWYGVHLLAWLLVLGAVAPAISNKILPQPPRIWQRFPAGGVSDLLFQAAIQTPDSIAVAKRDRLKSWMGLILSPLGAIGGLVLLNRTTDITSLGGVLVGGALGIWFYAAGIVWLLANMRVSRLTLPGLGLGLGLFFLLWVAFGAMGQIVWLQWWLVPARLQLWLWLSLLCFPWLLASGIAQRQGGIESRFIWWLGQSLVLVVGLLATIQFIPQIGFIFLLLPVFPLFLAMFAIASASVKDIWAYAIGCSLFFSWAIAAAFPLVG